MDTSADTLYNYASDGTLSPFVVRTPSAHTMEPEVFFFIWVSIPTVITLWKPLKCI